MHPIFKYQFFIIVIPGLEEIALREIKYKLGDSLFSQSLFELSEGGISVSTDHLDFMDFFHKNLKIPTRLLLRLHESKVRDFPKMFNHFKRIDWQKYIPWVTPNLSFSSKNSKVFDDRKVLKCLTDAVSLSIKANEPKKKYKELPWQELPTVYVRIEDDNCVTSIDLTGERFDRRGKKLNTVHAPIRESIGAALAFLTLEEIEKNAHYDATIFDPMAGSGTLLFELSCFFNSNTRSYNYEYMPIFSKIKSIIPVIENKFLSLKYIFNDIDEAAVKSIRLNIENYDMKNPEILQADFFDIKLDSNTHRRIYILCNPPYDKRLKIDCPMDEFLERFISTTKKLNSISTIFVTPTENTIKEVHTSIKFLNGGLRTKIVQL